MGSFPKEKCQMKLDASWCINTHELINSWGSYEYGSRRFIKNVVVLQVFVHIISQLNVNALFMQQIYILYSPNILCIKCIQDFGNSAI